MTDDDRERIDFGALDPTRDGQRFADRIASITGRAEPLLAARRRPIDLEALDPTRDPERFDELVAGIADRAALLLARRRGHAGTLAQLARWQRPVAAAAALVLILSYALLSRVGGAPVETGRTTGFSEALGVPGQIVQWMRAEQPPSAAEIMFTVAEN